MQRAETYGPEQFARGFGVSRETTGRLTEYVAALELWNRKINLVAPATLPNAWKRHIADSAQLWDLRRPAAATWLDIGSGAGFPGLVAAILACEAPEPVAVTLVESDARKCAFLHEVRRRLELQIDIRQTRIEHAVLPPPDVLSARALAPLETLIGHLARLGGPGTQALFLKGRGVDKELDAARREWDFEYKLHPSRTEPDAAIVEIGAVHGPR